MDKASHQLVKIMLYDLVENGLLTSAEADLAFRYYAKRQEQVSAQKKIHSKRESCDEESVEEPMEDP